ncbi:hypothetical protein ACLOJK_007089 [Asimina triloba]
MAGVHGVCNCRHELRRGPRSLPCKLSFHDLVGRALQTRRDSVGVELSIINQYGLDEYYKRRETC